MTIFTIDILSDTVCPWCYIGLRRLQKAIMIYQKTYPAGSNDTFNITWKPYYLDPSAPEDGIRIQDKMVSRMDPERIERILLHLQSIGASEGITFTFGGKTGNSRLSHRLLQLAKMDSLEMQGKVAEEIFRLHFEGEGNITDIEMLVTAGVNAGLVDEQIKKGLEDEEVGRIVDEEVLEGNAISGNGVPRFILQGGKHQVDGAGDSLSFFELFTQIKEEEGSV